MRQWSRNADDRIRQLERRLAETGDRYDALSLYRAQRQVHGPRDHMDHPQFEIELPRLGPVVLIPQGSAVRILSPGPGHEPVPVTVNRVDYRVSGAYFFYPDLGWVPVRPENVEQVLRGPFGGKREGPPAYDPTHRWMNAFDLSRIDYVHYRDRDASQSAYKKFMTAMDRAFQAWVLDHPRELAAGAVVSANNQLWRLQSDYDKLAEKMAALDDQVADAIMQEQANK